MVQRHRVTTRVHAESSWLRTSRPVCSHYKQQPTDASSFVEMQLKTILRNGGDKTGRNGCACLPVDQVDFKEGTSASSDVSVIKATPEYDSLRTEYGADLVQLIGYYGDSCGAG